MSSVSMIDGHIDREGITSQEAIKIESYLLDREKPDYKLSEKIMAAVEKQIPKKFELWNGQCSCPNCKALFGSYKTIKRLVGWKMPRCKFCGQALDWSCTK